MKLNKTIFERLKDYFLKSDHEVVSAVLANCIMDLYKIWNIDSLSQEDLEILQTRMLHNMKQLEMFDEEKEHAELKMSRYPEMDKNEK